MKTMAARAGALLGLLVVLVAPAPAQPHPPDTVSWATDSAAPDTVSWADSAAASPAPRPPYQMPPLMKAVTDHPHNKLIHFPLVLTIVAAALLIVARKRPELEPVAFWLVWMAALSVIPAYFSGKAQQENFIGKPKEWLAEIHEKQGITIGVLQALWVLSLIRAGTRRWAWVIGIVLVVIVSAAGFIGGLLAHGR